ncbi:antibiotic biosynthesis monooxygenase [Mesorhizobium caraganae]|uniref:Antibiotic biosynthesis monooxygenase n=1 Tax=Mesorhizobium caraganae TaxID=483206 RepID=A0ABV1YU68_9HYPH
MLVIIGTIRLPAERLDEARPAMQRMILGSRTEPGCIDYSYAQDVLDATEVWSDREALDAHFRSPHIADWRASWAALGIGERNLMLYEAGEPKPT